MKSFIILAFVQLVQSTLISLNEHQLCSRNDRDRNAQLDFTYSGLRIERTYLHSPSNTVEASALVLCNDGRLQFQHFHKMTPEQKKREFLWDKVYCMTTTPSKQRDQEAEKWFSGERVKLNKKTRRRTDRKVKYGGRHGLHGGGGGDRDEDEKQNEDNNDDNNKGNDEYNNEDESENENKHNHDIGDGNNNDNEGRNISEKEDDDENKTHTKPDGDSDNSNNNGEPNDNDGSQLLEKRAKLYYQGNRNAHKSGTKKQNENGGKISMAKKIANKMVTKPAYKKKYIQVNKVPVITQEEARGELDFGDRPKIDNENYNNYRYIDLNTPHYNVSEGDTTEGIEEGPNNKNENGDEGEHNDVDRDNNETENGGNHNRQYQKVECYKFARRKHVAAMGKKAWIASIHKPGSFIGGVFQCDLHDEANAELQSEVEDYLEYHPSNQSMDLVAMHSRCGGNAVAIAPLFAEDVRRLRLDTNANDADVEVLRVPLFFTEDPLYCTTGLLGLECGGNGVLHDGGLRSGRLTSAMSHRGAPQLQWASHWATDMDHNEAYQFTRKERKSVASAVEGTATVYEAILNAATEKKYNSDPKSISSNKVNAPGLQVQLSREECKDGLAVRKALVAMPKAKANHYVEALEHIWKSVV